MPAGHPSLKGQLLLDGGKLCGSYFHRTVVLICEHNAEGAFGLVLNRPSEVRLAAVLGPERPDSLRTDALLGGGLSGLTRAGLTAGRAASSQATRTGLECREGSRFCRPWPARAGGE